MKLANIHNKSRPYIYKAQERLAKPLLRLLKISPLKLSRSARSRPKQARHDQLTIEVLRYRLNHPEAVAKPVDGSTYSEAFKGFLLTLYHESYKDFTPEQFAQAADIQADALRSWLTPAPGSMLEKIEMALPAQQTSREHLKLSEHFEKWLSVTRDFLHAMGSHHGWRAHQIKAVLSKVIRAMIRVIPKPLAYRHYDKIAALTPATSVFFTGYGAQLLKQSYQKNLSRALAISVTLHFIVLHVYLAVGDWTRPEQPAVKTVRIMIYPELESEIEKKLRAAGSAGNERGQEGWGNAAIASAPPKGIFSQNDILVPVKTSSYYSTIPPGPNALDIRTDIPMIDVAGLQELANQGIPSSIAGDGTTPLMQFIPKSGKAPQIDLASIGGEAGTVLPASNIPGAQGQIWPAGMSGSGYDPSLVALQGGSGGGSIGGGGYSTGRSGGSLANGNHGNGYGAGKSGSGVDDFKIENTGAKSIALKSSGEKDWKSRDLKKLFQELFEWMKNNPYPFPPALKHYMRFKNGDMTSRVAIATTETQYELFLLCNDASEDFGLLLVAAGDSTEAICLRDTGFRKQSFYLSKGIASRNENAAVGSVSMLEQRPTLQETSKFYNIFLSWWDKTKAGEQKKS